MIGSIRPQSIQSNSVESSRCSSQLSRPKAPEMPKITFENSNKKILIPLPGHDNVKNVDLEVHSKGFNIGSGAPTYLSYQGKWPNQRILSDAEIDQVTSGFKKKKQILVLNLP